MRHVYYEWSDSTYAVDLIVSGDVCLVLGTFGLTSGIVISTGRVTDINKGDTSAVADGPTAKQAADFGASGAIGDDIGFELALTPTNAGSMSFRCVCLTCRTNALSGLQVDVQCNAQHGSILHRDMPYDTGWSDSELNSAA